MSKRKLSTSELAAIVESEGLGFTIENEVNATRIKDEDLADMWSRAKELIDEIQAYIEDNADSVDDADEADEDRDDEDEEY